MKSIGVAAAALAYISSTCATPNPTFANSSAPALPPGSVFSNSTMRSSNTSNDTSPVNPLWYFLAFEWHKDCTTAQRRKFRQAWTDSKELADALSSWRALPSDPAQAAMDMYMGTDNRYWNIVGEDYAQRIKDTADRIQGLYEAKSNLPFSTLYVACSDQPFWFTSCFYQVDGIGSVVETEAAFSNTWYFVLCKGFFDDKWAVPWQTRKDELRKNNPNPNIIESYMGKSGTAAYWVLHAILHMSTIVTKPRAEDYVAWPQGDYNWARRYNTKWTLVNADSWSCTALAIWAQKTFNLPSPPIPSYIAKHPPTTNDDPPGDPGISMATNSSIINPVNTTDPNSPYYMNPSDWEPETLPFADSSYDPSSDSSSSDSSSSDSSSSDSMTSNPSPYVTSPTAAPAPAYATGICSFHLTEVDDCDDPSKSLSGIVDVFDGAGKRFGPLPSPPYVSINDGDPLIFNSTLPYPLVITGEHVNDYVQFTYGGLSWTSSAPNGGGRCETGGWDPREGPHCHPSDDSQQVFATRDMDCFFPC